MHLLTIASTLVFATVLLSSPQTHAALTTKVLVVEANGNPDLFSKPVITKLSPEVLECLNSFLERSTSLIAWEFRHEADPSADIVLALEVVAHGQSNRGSGTFNAGHWFVLSGRFVAENPLGARCSFPWDDASVENLPTVTVKNNFVDQAIAQLYEQAATYSK
jgi:hypothetical protein